MNEYNVVNRANIRLSFNTALIVNFSFLLFLVPNQGRKITSRGRVGGPACGFFNNNNSPLAKCQFTSNFLKGMSSIYTVKLYATFLKLFVFFFCAFFQGRSKVPSFLIIFRILGEFPRLQIFCGFL